MDKPAAPEIPVGVGGFAEGLVRDWLRAGADSADLVRPYLGIAPDLTGVGADSRAAEWTANIGVTDVGSGQWAVTVLADVADQDPTGTGFEAAELRAYRVLVATADSGFVAVALPHPVPVPIPEPARVAYPVAVSVSGPPGGIGDAVTGFLNAYVAGEGELSRYVSPGSALSPVDPPVADQVRVVALAGESGISEDAPPTDGQVVRVMATAVLTDQTGSELVVSYPLRLTGRGGRWEITDLDAVALSNQPTLPDANATSSPTGE